MRVLFIGDIFSIPGLKATLAFLAEVGEGYDFVVANGENIAGGFGIARKHFEQLRRAGVDAVTLGNHSFDQAETASLLEETPRLLRPANYPVGTPGLGFASYAVAGGGRITVAQVMGRVFMDPQDDPFVAADRILEQAPEDEPVLFDIHAEATSEKKILGYHLSGRASAVIGTHTHVQTADETLFRGTAYITDVGMTGVQASSVGMNFAEVHYRFTTKRPRRYRPAGGEATVCAVALEFSGRKAVAIERIQWCSAPG